MLLQSHAGEIHLLPALPAAWPSGEVRGLRARGAVDVGIQWKDRSLVRATLVARRGGRIRVRYRDTVREYDASPGQQIVVTP
jgi:alpha-L-fucosidase 2